MTESSIFNDKTKFGIYIEELASKDQPDIVPKRIGLKPQGDIFDSHLNNLSVNMDTNVMTNENTVKVQPNHYQGPTTDLITEQFNTEADANITKEQVNAWAHAYPEKITLCEDGRVVELPGGSIKPLCQTLISEFSKTETGGEELTDMTCLYRLQHHDHWDQDLNIPFTATTQSGDEVKAFAEKTIAENPRLEKHLDEYRNTEHGKEFENFDLGQDLEQTNGVTHWGEPTPLPADSDLAKAATDNVAQHLAAIASEASVDLPEQWETTEVPLVEPKEEDFATEDEYLGALADYRLATQKRVKVDLENEAADDESFALSAEGTFEAKVEIPGAEEAAKAGEGKVAILGVGAPSIAAMTANANQYFGAQQAKEAETKDVTPAPVLSKAQKKKQAAIAYNEEQRMKHNVLICKYRTSGLTVRLEILTMSNRAAHQDRTKGMFATYTINSAIAASKVCYLPWQQQNNQSIINQVTLDWLLDQIGETYAFEVRTGRIQPNTPRKFEITKTAEEWIAKGFYVHNGEVAFY